MSEELPPNVKTIDLKNGSRIYVNTDEEEYKHVEGISNIDLVYDTGKPVIIGKTWICKKCNLDNEGVICSECKRYWNPADPMCDFKD